MPRLVLDLMAGEFAVCRLAATAPTPAWAESTLFNSVTRTTDELSVVCPAAQVPAGVKHEGGWRLLKFHGPFAFGETGILASVLSPLAGAGVGILAIATFDTDYVLVPGKQLAEAVTALQGAGHAIRGA